MAVLVSFWRGQHEIWGGYKQQHQQGLLKKYASDAANDPIECDLRYQGQIYDRETGLYYNRHRYYDTDSGQYLSSDPIGFAGGLRPQAYVHNPMDWVDPLGLAGCPGTKRSADGRLRNADGTYAYDGGPKKTASNSSHGNTRTPDTEATLYGKFDADGNFEKWGISQDASTRYSSKELAGGRIKEYRRGPRDQMLDKERRLVERFPGPKNKEPWAGSKRPK